MWLFVLYVGQISKVIYFCCFFDLTEAPECFFHLRWRCSSSVLSTGGVLQRHAALLPRRLHLRRKWTVLPEPCALVQLERVPRKQKESFNSVKTSDLFWHVVIMFIVIACVTKTDRSLLFQAKFSTQNSTSSIKKSTETLQRKYDFICCQSSVSLFCFRCFPVTNCTSFSINIHNLGFSLTYSFK